MRAITELGAGASSIPFVTIVTRCYRRPTFLQDNIESLKGQSDPDYEHIRLIDEQGVGIGGANRALAAARPKGRYVLVLDDDDMLTDTGAIAALKEATADNPHIVVFKADHDKHGILPSGRVWNKRPHMGHIGSCDFITRRDWWNLYIESFGKQSAGDFAFLDRMWKHNPDVVWLDRKLAAVQRVSNGRPE